MPRTAQTSFTGGEVDPSVQARNEIAKIRDSLALCRNFLVRPQGGVANRTGTRFSGELGDHSQRGTLIPFRFSVEDTYVLMFQAGRMRVIRNGAFVTNAGVAITGITQAIPAVVTTGAAHGLLTGDDVFLSGIGGMTPLNGRAFKITKLTGNTYELDGIDSTILDPYTTGGLSAPIYELTANVPYTEPELDEIRWSQSNDVMKLTFPEHEERELTRTDHNAWTMTTVSYEPDIEPVSNLVATSGGAAAYSYEWAVTAIDRETGEESLPQFDGITSSTEVTAVETTQVHRLTWRPPLEAIQAIASITQANPAVVSIANHGYSDGDKVFLENVAGMTEVDDRLFTVANSDLNTFELENEDASGHTAFTSGDCARSRANKFNVYRRGQLTSRATPIQDAPIGFVGQSSSAEWYVKFIEPSVVDTPPQARNPFVDGNNPVSVAHFDQRVYYGGAKDSPVTIYGTQVGSFKNLGVSVPVVPSDAITATIAAREQNAIQHIVALDDLIVLTIGGEWRIFGDDAGALLPNAFNPRPQGYNGSSSVTPLVIGNDILHIDESGSQVFALSFRFEKDSYGDTDLTVLADHLFEGRSIVRWAHTKRPHSVVWAVMSDGDLVSCSYVPAHEVFAWSRHDTNNGVFESVAAVREGNEDAVYFIVKRKINGIEKRYVERLEARHPEDIQDAFFVDSGLTLDNPIDVLAVLNNATAEIISDPHGLVTGDLFDIEGLELSLDAQGDPIPHPLNGNRYQVIGGTPTTILIGDQETGAAISGLAFPTYVGGGRVRRVETTLKNLGHLDGEIVSVLSNGSVEEQTVSNGMITLQEPGSRVHVGKKITADLGFLDLRARAPDGALQGTPANVSEVYVRMVRSRGFSAGPTLDKVAEVPWREDEDWGDPTLLLTGEKAFVIDPEWSDFGRWFLRQDNPLPLQIISVGVEYESGD